MPLKSLMIMSVMLCIVLSGCGRKKGKDAAENLDSLKTASVSSEESEDIFDEFYDEESEGKKKKESESTMEAVPTPSSDVEFNPNGRYVVQVSCVLSRSLADNIATQLERKGYPAYLAEVVNPTPELIGTYYRIRIGGFTGVSKARNFGENYLTRDGYEFWVDNRSNDNVGMGGTGLGETRSDGYESAYTPEPEPAPTPPAEDLTAPEATAPPEESEITQPSTPVPVIETPAAIPENVVEPVPQPPETETGVTPVQTETPPQKPAAPTEDWGEAEDEWGADTTKW